ncbi:MAG: hypothetical protein EAS52_04245 [Parapedobacter sp.]|nr:MAG: hypothetical protein EAS52_04245 [Parapedobacter sp.]
MIKTAMKPISRAIRLLWMATWISTPALHAQLPAQDSLQQLLNAHPQHDDRRAELLNSLAFFTYLNQATLAVWRTVDCVTYFAGRIPT